MKFYLFKKCKLIIVAIYSFTNIKNDVTTHLSVFKCHKLKLKTYEYLSKHLILEKIFKIKLKT